MTRTEVLALQRALNGSGLAYDVLGKDLVEDGIYGPKTKRVHLARLSYDRLSYDPAIPTITPEPAKPWWTSRALLGGLATIIVGIAGLAGYALDVAQITEIVVSASALAAGIISTVGTIRRKGAIDPTLVARVGARDIRLPVRAERKSPSGSGRSDPRGHFETD